MKVMDMGGGERKRSIEPFPAFSPSKWENLTPPHPDWLIEGCFLKGTVGMMSGDGGVGKSLLCQQLLTAAAIGKPWLGLRTQQCPTFGFFCEDDEDELHRRQASINQLYGCTMADLDTVTYSSRVAMENVIMTFDKKTGDEGRTTGIYSQLKFAIEQSGAKIAVIDTVADVFGGNENYRIQVRKFITELRKIALRMQGVIILTAHPSVGGMASGTGSSGSTAWNNSVRSRIYLTREKGFADGEDEDNNKRTLKTMKNNQGPGRGKIPLIWHQGVFERTDTAEGPVKQIEAGAALMDCMRRLHANGTQPAAKYDAKNSLCSEATKLGYAKDITWKALTHAQDKLVADNRLELFETGPPSGRVTRLRLGNNA